MTTKNLGPRENPDTEAAMYRNRARSVADRIAQRRALGKPPTKDQSADLARYLGLAEQADADAAAKVPAGI